MIPEKENNPQENNPQEIKPQEYKKSRTPDFCDLEQPNKCNNNWMLKIDDKKFISELSIPGTHDSCARNGFLAECQSWSIEDQLNAGIRYFDLRFRRVDNYFCIHHGFIYEHINFSDVLKKIELYFKDFPSEGVIMRVKEEYDADNPTDSFVKMFKNYCKSFPDLLLLKKEIPTMKEMRSKVWVLQDGYELGSKSWDSLAIQDHYDFKFNKNLDKKKEEIKNHMSKANESSQKELFANHCSAKGEYFKEPHLVAKEINKVISEDGVKLKKIGIIIFDFPGEEVIKFIIDKNYLE